MATFGAVGVSTVFNLPPRRSLSLVISGTFVARLELQQRAGANAWKAIREFRAGITTTIDLLPGDYRLHCVGYTSGTVTYALTAAAAAVVRQADYRDNAGNLLLAIDDDGVQFVEPVEDALTAAAGGTQAAALALSASKTVHRVTVCATTADSVALPAAVVGQSHTVINSGAASLQVFGTGSDTIDAAAAATGVAVASGKTALFVCPVAGKWFRLLSG